LQNAQAALMQLQFAPSKIPIVWRAFLMLEALLALRLNHSQR
jgi:hypothetical protein